MLAGLWVTAAAAQWGALRPVVSGRRPQAEAERLLAAAEGLSDEELEAALRALDD